MNAPQHRFVRDRELTLPIWPSARPLVSQAKGEWRLTAGLFAAALGYATLRYNVFKGVPWSDWPAYVVNKGLAVASLLIMAAAVWRWRLGRGPARVLIAAAGVLALAHSLLSFALLDPAYYERLFTAGKLTPTAGLSITLGVLAMAAMDLGARRGEHWPRRVRVRSLALVALGSGLHAALPAIAGWLEPAKWPGGLPPLTLISFVAGLVALAAGFRHLRNRA